MRRWKSLTVRCVVAACSLGLGATVLASTPAEASTPHPHGTYTAYLVSPSSGPFTLVIGWRHEGEIGGTSLSWSASHGTITTLEYITMINPYTGQPFTLPVTMTGQSTKAGISSASDPGTVEVNGNLFGTWYAVRISGG